MKKKKNVPIIQLFTPKIDQILRITRVNGGEAKRD